MKQKLLLFACCLFNLMLRSQSENKGFLYWSSNTGSQNYFYKNATAVASSGNIYVVGATINGSGNADILITKFAPEGDILWTDQINGAANSADYGAGVIIDDLENIYITGAVSNNTVNPVETDLIVIKYDVNGNRQWNYTYNGSGSLDGGRGIVVDGTYNVFVTGGSYNSSANTDIVTIGLASDGTQQWVNTYDYNSLDDIGYDISFAKAGVLLVTGAATSSAYNYVPKLLTIDASSGSTDDDYTGTAVSTSSVDLINDVAIDAQKNIYITGGYDVSGQGMNYYTMKLDSTLATQWTQTYNGSSNLDDVARGLGVDVFGNVYVTGYSTSATQGRNFVTIMYDASGSQQWTQTFNGMVGGNDEAFDLKVDNSRNVYVTGMTMTDINNMDYYTIKYNSGGAKVWDVLSDAHHLNDRATNIAIDNGNNIVVTGQCETAPNVYEYVTELYIQRDIITPADFNGETPSNNFRYYANKGQLIKTNGTSASEINYHTYNTYPTFYFKNNSQSFVFSRIDTIISTADTLHRIDLSFTNSYESAKTYPMEQKRDGYLNYYLAHTGTEGITGVFGNQKLITTGLYNNIDLMSSSNQNGIKYYFIVKPGGDPRDIKFNFNGATSYSLNGSTNALSINSSIGSITFDRPTAYQLSSTNSTIAVTGWTPDWQTDGASNLYKFNTGAYTSSLTLIIEVDQGNGALSPTSTNNPVWCTDYGSSDYDQVYDVDSDASGDLYATGYTNDQTSFPPSPGITAGGAGMQEAFLLSFKPFGTPKWRIIYGGTGIDQGWNIKVDNTNSNVYMTGYTGYAAASPYNTDFPLKNVSGAYNHTSASGSGVPYYGFISKFDMNNGFWKWATLFGDDNAGQTHIYGLDVASNGEVYIGGSAIVQTGFPIVTPSTGCTVHSQNMANKQPAFIAKFSAANQLLWSTHFGNDLTSIMDLRVNSQNELFITGQSGPNNTYSFPMAQEFTSDYQQSHGGGAQDAFVAKFSNCLQLKWSTFMGGTGDDVANAIEISEGTSAPSKMQTTSTFVYLCGATKSSSTSFPLVSNGNSNSINVSTLSGSQDGFITAFNSGNQMNWNTYVGGSNNDQLNDMEFGKAGTLFLTGATKSTDFLNVNYTGLYNQTQLENTSGGNDYDAVVLALDGHSTFTKRWSTFFGGNTSIGTNRSDDYAYGITTTNNYVYIGGLTWSFNNFPWNANLTTYPGAYYQPNLAGSFSQDGFLAQFDLTNTVLSVEEIKALDDNGFYVYPNPSNGLVYISLNDKLINDGEKITIQVFDVQGRIILTKSVTKMQNENFSLNLSQVSTGMYFIKLLTENLNTSQKIIIQN